MATRKVPKKPGTKKPRSKANVPPKIEGTGSDLFGAAADSSMSARFRKAVKQGRKPSYETVPQMQKVICEYFDECFNRKAPATITGLALSLGISRDQLRRYGNKNENFRTLVKTAKEFVEHSYEELLVHGKGSTPGVIFALKQLDWKDKQEVEHKGQVAIIAADEDDL